MTTRPILRRANWPNNTNTETETGPEMRLAGPEMRLAGPEMRLGWTKINIKIDQRHCPTGDLGLEPY